MLTALLMIAIFFGLVQEVRIPGKLRFVSFNYRSKKHSAKRSALITVTNKSKS
jgi:hypothetical protein